MSQKPITFYDIATKAAPKPGPSPFTAKVRCALNFKGIKFTTVWLEYPEIEAECKRIGAPPTGKKPDGSPFYTLPVIQDPATGLAMSESNDILEYLDKAYPDTPKLFPGNTLGIQLAFDSAAQSRLLNILPLVIAYIPAGLNPAAEAHWRSGREGQLGKRIEELEPKGEARVAALQKLQASLGEVDGWISKNGGGKFITGDEMTFVDISLGGALCAVRVALGDQGAALWEEISGWHGGRWEKLRKACEPLHK
ncbi:GST N-terminal domain-containing protein [Pleurotus pulmonarius]